MDILGVDHRHHEGANFEAKVRIDLLLGSRGLGGALEAGGQGEGAHHHPHQAGIFLHGRHGGLAAGRRTAR